VEHAESEEIELRPTVHGPLERLEAVDRSSFRPPVAEAVPRSPTGASYGL